jgi:hypothetical protein
MSTTYIYPLNFLIMGTLSSGINGPFRGRVGVVIGSSINGRPYVKGPYKRRTKKVSEAELANRKKFAMAQAWLDPLVAFVRIGFKNYSERSQGFVAAKSYLLRNAFEGVQPNISINPSLVKVSYGNLALPGNIAVTKLPDQILQFTWDTSPIPGTDPCDQAMLLAYQPEAGTHYSPYNYTTTGQFRKTGMDTLQLHFPGIYHVYFAMVSHDRARQSGSVYLGEIEV